MASFEFRVVDVQGVAGGFRSLDLAQAFARNHSAETGTAATVTRHRHGRSKAGKSAQALEMYVNGKLWSRSGLATSTT